MFRVLINISYDVIIIIIPLRRIAAETVRNCANPAKHNTRLSHLMFDSNDTVVTAPCDCLMEHLVNKII